MDTQKLLSDVADKIQTGESFSESPILSFLEFLPSDSFYKLSEFILGVCQKCENRKAVKFFCDCVNNTRQRIDLLPAPTVFFLNHYMNSETRKFIMNCFPTVSLEDHVVHIVNMMDVGEAMRAVQTMQDDGMFSGKVNWKFLYSLTDDVEDIEYHNSQLRDWLRDQMKNCNSKPEWIHDFEKKELLEVPKLPSVKEAVELLLTDLENRVKITSKIRETLISLYATATVQEKIDLLRQVHPMNDFSDEDIFRELGPCNTQYTSNPDLLPKKCSKYGGCRMFLCTEFECDEEDICSSQVKEITEWFIGKCQSCDKIIPKKHYAVREPLHHGGWKGCYCSLECIEKQPRVVKNLLRHLNSQLLQYGIRER